MTDPREFETILASLSSLQKSLPASPVFGAQVHSFKLDPPLKESDIIKFESKHKIMLPEDYRDFLAYAGNGGAGPVYGFFRLGEMDNGHKHAHWKENDGFVGNLSAPFPHVEAWNDLAGKPEFDDSQAATQSNFDYEDAYGKSMSEWEAEKYWNSRNVDGAIPLCHLGCANRLWLVVTGPERGHIWCDDRADLKGIYPLEMGGLCRTSFLEWYRSWLNEALNGC